MNMYLTESLPKVFIELYLKEEISLSKAADMTGMDIEGFKERLKTRGLKVSTYTGSKEDEETGLRFI